jgi:deoxyhypusine synthase
MVAEQSQEIEDDGEMKRLVWTPSSVIKRLGKEIDNEESVYYWCYKVRRIFVWLSLVLDMTQADQNTTTIVFQ